MIKILFLLLIPFIIFANSNEFINECVTDVYFANGIMNSPSDAEKSLELIYDEIKVNFYNSNEAEMLKHHNFDTAFNQSYGMAPDLFESLLQKADESISGKLTWSLFKELLGRFLKAGSVVSILEAMTNAAKNADLTEQIEHYTKSIKAGHGVVVIAHSQGNLFTNEAYTELDPWMHNYFKMIAVASPTSRVSGNGPIVSWDNDLVGLMGMHSERDTANPVRKVTWLDLGGKVSRMPYSNYVYKAQVNQIFEDRFEAEETFADRFDSNVHAFPFYMGEALSRDGKEIIPNGMTNTPLTIDIAKFNIIGNIGNFLQELKEAPSQWKKSKETGCNCDKIIEVMHQYDPTMNTLMKDKKVLPFNEEAKLYMAEGQYVKAICGGESIVENENEEICFDLNNEKDETIAQMDGFDEIPSKKDGVVEVLLNWSKPDLNYDLIVEWDAGEVDVKDTCKPEEHFHIKSEMQIYPGTYSVSIVYKEGLPEDMNDTGIFPFTVDLNIFTPGASDKLHFTVKNRKDINLGHVANIKVYRLDDDDNEDGSGDGSISPPSAMIFAPDIAPSCPPVQHTPSPSPRKPVYYYSSSNGSNFTLYNWGSWGSWYGSSGGGTSSGSSIIDHHNCGGDTSCLPNASDSNHAGSDGTKSPLSPLPPTAGGEPVRDLEEEDDCEGDESCGCIPCEYEITPYLKQVYLGPLRDASFSIFALDQYILRNALYSGKTTDGHTLYDAGEMDLPIDVLEGLIDDAMYIIEVSGGEDIDSNDDFIVDAIATPNLGKVYAIATGRDIKYTGLKVNILTTVAFELVKEMVTSGKNRDEIALKMADIASRLLRYKVYPRQDEIISNIDLLAWLPTIDKDLLQRSYEPLENIVQSIYAGNAIYEDAYEYVYFKSSSDATVINNAEPPIIRGFVRDISENAQGGTVVGTIEILRGSDAISFGSLKGRGSEIFDIDVNGTIRLKADAVLDYETKWLYKLRAEAFNVNGGSGEVGVYISIINVLDAPEYVSFEGGAILENAPSGTVVGTLNFNEGASAITSFELQGESVDVFEIDTQGVIRLKDGAVLDYETKYSYGFVAFAHNNFGISLPVMLYINVTDFADIPSFQEYVGGYILESATAGEVVGTIVFDKGGSDITSITLDGFGTENFTIGTDGVLRVAEGAMLDYETYSLYQPTVILTNSFGDSKATRIFIEVTDTRDTPSFTSFSGGNVKENSEPGTFVGQIVFDTGAAAIETITLSGEGSEIFRVLDNGMIIVAQNSLNYEEKNRYILKAIASNTFGPSLEVILTIYVDDISETPAVLSDFVKNDVLENSAVGTVIGQIEVLNQGSSAIEFFELSGARSDYFSIDSSGVITLAKPLDFEVQEIYNLHVKAKNSAGFGNSVNVIVRVKSIIGVIPVLKNLSLYVDKEVVIGSIINNILVDSGEAPITSLTLFPTSPFEVDLNGTITLAHLLTEQNTTSYELQAQAENIYGQSEVVDVNITIIQAPVIDNFTVSLFDGSTSNTTVGKINIVTNGTAITSVVLQGEGNDDFTVDVNGILHVAADITLDFNTRSDYNLTVVINNTYEADVTIHVLNRIIGSYVPSNTQTYGVELSLDDTKVYVRDYKGLNVLDVSQQNSPTLLAKVYMPNAIDFEVSSDGTMAVALHGGLTIYDISDLSNRTIISTLSIDANPNKIVLSKDNSKVFIGTQTSFQIVDISDPANPFVINSMQNIGNIQHVLLSNDETKAFITDPNFGLKILDIRDLQDIKVVSTLALDWISDMKLSLDETKLYVSNHDFLVLDIRDIEKPYVLNSIAIDSVGVVSFNKMVISSDETKAFVNTNIVNYPHYFYGLFVLDISDISNLSKLGSIEVAGNTTDIAISSNDDTVFVATYSGLQIVDVRGFDVPEKLPGIIDFKTVVELTSSIGSTIGSIDVFYTGSRGISSFKLSGDGAEDFSIDLNGVITLKNILNYDKQKSYRLKATATNSVGSREVDVDIRVHAIPELQDLNVETFSMAKENTLVGKIDMWVDNNTTITKITLTGSGSENFTINANGEIHVNANAELHYFITPSYILNAIATNSYGSSNKVTVQISISAFVSLVDIDDVKDIALSSDGTKAYVINNAFGLYILDISNPTAPFIITSRSIPGNTIQDIILSSDETKAYILDSWSGMHIIDVSDLATISIISNIRTSGHGYNMVVSSDGTKAYIADNQSGLCIVNISNPLSPSILAYVNTSGQAYDVALSTDNTKAYVADGSSGLQIIDISDPTAASIVSSIFVPDFSRSVTLSSDETKAYVAATHMGLQIIDISNPLSPSILTYVNTPGQAYDVALSEDNTKAYVADRSSGLQIIDISDFTAPSIVTSVDTSGLVNKIVLSTDETKVFLLDENSGLIIVEIQEVSLPDKIPGALDFFGIGEENSSIGSVIGKIEIVYSGSSGISSFELSGEGAEDFSIALDGVITLKNNLNYTNQKNYYLKATATNSIGSREVDVSLRVHAAPEIQDFSVEVNSMTKEGTFIGMLDMWIDNNETLYDIALIGAGSENFTINTNGEIYASAGTELQYYVNSLYIFSAIATNNYGSSNEAKVQINIVPIISSVNTEEWAYSVVLSLDNTKAFMVDREFGLQVIDISDPTSPSIIGSVDTPGFAYDVKLSSDGTKAFIADGYSLHTIDISDPTSPSIISSIYTSGFANSVMLSFDNTKVFIANGYAGLQIVDISDPITPSIIGSIDTPNDAKDITLSLDETKIFIADGNSGLQVIDISDPTSPSIIGSVDTPGFASHVILSSDGTKAFVTNISSGLQIIDISDPIDPHIINSVKMPNYAEGLTLSSDGTKVFVANGNSGLQVIDISDPAAAFIINSIDTPSFARSVTLSLDENQAYVADQESGLQIIDISGFQ